MKTQADDLEIKKQEEIKSIVDDHNKRNLLVLSETFQQIEHSTVLTDDEKTALKAKFPSGEKTERIAVPALIGIQKEKPATIAIARELFGNDRFISSHRISDMFGDRVKVQTFAENTKLTYSVVFLEELLKALPSTMVYQSLPTSGVIGLDEFATICKGRQPKSGGILLYADQFDVNKGIVSKKAWFADKQYSEFRKGQFIAPNMFRVATDAEIPGTANKRFVDQVMIACDWIEKSFKQSITETMKSAIAEIRKDAKMLESLQNNDSAGFVKQVAGYQFFKNFMETSLETLWRMITYEQVSGTKLLQNMYLRNNVVEPVYACLGYSGFWDGNGPNVYRYDARYSYSPLGLGFSCTGI
jgi:hypothetical protein